MLHSWCRDTMTIKRAALVEERGSLVYDWDNATEHVIKGCSVQPSDSSRDFNAREDNSTFRLHCFMPFKADIKEGDRVEVSICDGVFEIDGVPYIRQSPTGRVSSTQVDLVRWEG